jgi:hypothetical protein
VERVTSREIEVDGQVTIELAVDGSARAELRWNGALPLTGDWIGWTFVDASTSREWPWDALEHRDLAQLADALHDHRHHRATRSEMRVRYWEYRARDTTAEAAAAWGRAMLTAD